MTGGVGPAFCACGRAPSGLPRQHRRSRQGPFLRRLAAVRIGKRYVRSGPPPKKAVDYFAALGASAYGATPEAAAALALTVHALWVPVTAAGLLCYWAPPTHRHSASLGAPR